MKPYIFGLIFSVSFAATAHESANVAALNHAIEQCFEHTEAGSDGKVRACNTLVRSRHVSREIKGTAFHNRGVIFLNQGKRALALKDFQRAMKLLPESEETQLAIMRLKGGSEKREWVAKRQGSENKN